MAEQIKGKYVLDRRLGCGGMAEVFVGRRIGVEGFTRPVAIKRVLPEHSADAQFRSMFVAEARLSARLEHGNVVAVHDFDEDEDGRLFLVMELVDGTDLDGLLRTGPLPLPVVLSVTSEILRGLGHAHDLPGSDDTVRGLVHRDVSPQNVLLGWDGAVKVSDFGIAKARAATRASASFYLKGKLAYMSPEQANGAALDGRSDLFAVGVMLWEMLCGEPLLPRDSVQATLKSLLFDPVPPPRSRRPELPEDVERVAMRLLEKDREHRHRNADAAIAELAACAAYPKNGRELLSALLIERLPDRARQRSAGNATRLEPPPALGAAGAAPEGTRIASPVAPIPPQHVDPYAAAAGRISRSRRIVPLALLGAAVALAAGLVVGTAAHLKGGRDSAAPASSASAPAAPPLPEDPPSSDLRAGTATRAPLEPPMTSALATPAPAEAPRDDAGTAIGPRSPAAGPIPPQERKARSAPAGDTASRAGIREIDLGEPARN